MVSRNTKLTSMFTRACHYFYWARWNVFFKFYCNICLPALTSTYIPWIHKCDIKTVGCGTSHKDTNIQIFSVEHYEYFTKMLSIILVHKLLYFKAQCFLCYSPPPTETLRHLSSVPCKPHNLLVPCSFIHSFLINCQMK